MSAPACAPRPAISKPVVVLVGGFLGAGKTTLILAAAEELRRRGLRSAIVLNDQGESLVDTLYAGLRGMQTGEVAGGCFCCRLSDLLGAMETLRAHAPDVIFAEPVGSCTDIAATVLHPLFELGDAYRLAPFTVLVDPARAAALLQEGADTNLAFLFRKQLQEADLVCYTKADLYPHLPELQTHTGTRTVRQLSAHTGQGVAAWLDEMLAGELSADKETLDIDYEQYARAEAALAWLNFNACFEPDDATAPAMVLGPLMDGLDASLTAAGIPIVHMKAIVQGPTGFVKAALCANGDEPMIEGAVDASPASWHRLTLNLRALGPPERVSELVAGELQKLDGNFFEETMRCFCPAAPRPERRVTRVQ